MLHVFAGVLADDAEVAQVHATVRRAQTSVVGGRPAGAAHGIRHRQVHLARTRQVHTQRDRLGAAAQLPLQDVQLVVQRFYFAFQHGLAFGDLAQAGQCLAQAVGA
ncbi:hypothetical protein G6F22_020566 [Rhizopus arrhizus]|nr:hypothetical protein G6F22_020566 [Rhizopus arrhizus]